MSHILYNDIKKHIVLRYPGRKVKQQALESEIRTDIYKDREKTWTRILNNTSQPTLEEAIGIAQRIGQPMEKLFTFEKVQAA